MFNQSLTALKIIYGPLRILDRMAFYEGIYRYLESNLKGDTGQFFSS